MSSGSNSKSSNSFDLKTIAFATVGAVAVGAAAYGAYHFITKRLSGSGSGNDAKGADEQGSGRSGVDAVALSSKHRFPTLGFGTLCSAGDKPADIAQAVRDALSIGFRHIDCASAYNNEKEIGEVLKEFVVPANTQASALHKHKGLAIRRNELFVTSKLWGTAWNDVRSACKATLANLGLDYLDLYLVHWPFENCPPSADVKSGATPAPKHIGYSAERYSAVWAQMEELVKEGLVKSIGVSNMTIPKLQALLKTATIKPAVNQIEVHPYLAQPNLLAFCKAHQIVVSGYFVIGSARRAAFMRATSDPVLLGDQAVVDVAKEAGATPAQVLIAWALQRGTVPIVKALSPARIKENWAAYSVSLTAGQMKRLDALDRDFRYLKADIFAWPVTMPWRQLWDNEHVEKEIATATAAAH